MTGHSRAPGGQAAGHRRPLALVLAISTTIVLAEVAGLSLALVAAVLAERPATPERT